MKKVTMGKPKAVAEWLLFFYSLPSKPVKNRVKIWRKLAKVGAVQLKGSVYLLPDGEHHYEMLQWLVSEVAAMGGEGAFLRTARIESMEGRDIVALFNRAREKDYEALDRGIRELEARLAGSRKGGSSRIRTLAVRIDKLTREFQEIHKTDFFSSPAGVLRKESLDALKGEIAAMGRHRTEKPEAELSRRDIDDYRGKTWVTRRQPYVDRMATAWLIRRFIDREATFGFTGDKYPRHKRTDLVTFDIRGGDFTHVADMCTFEVVMGSFGIKDRALSSMAELVHELDLRDGKFDVPEARGVEDILMGIRKTAENDATMLAKGMEVFDMLYMSKT
ncbi:MAG: chromate resistance protein ChrB domain-containing protein [Thermodesulfovibrionales bacterium]